MTRTNTHKLPYFPLLLVALSLFSCQATALQKHGQHYQQHQDYKSLKKAVELLPLGKDTAYVRSILGDPIDMGFDFRYLIDSVGPRGCAFGAVFHIQEGGKVDDKWIGEICE